ncbi:hypothetical protein [Seohaeicola zhoushanensis]|uniref:Uncharacterized protein n=1 Tax=Seohaeicola zhoushanensis TaxID=1569283 RepID=A0A8J3M3E8_9RHOB|nr:hypothetical protein [Seohaeicola zhoushanensis]GHF33363.1 hypothetical protein GCM10017056_00970 [Seohaeicola zhoushanensis]
MDWLAITKELGGGLPALVIVALAFAYWQERREGRARERELIDRAFDREREHSRELVTTIDAVRTAGGRQ